MLEKSYGVLKCVVLVSCFPLTFLTLQFLLMQLFRCLDMFKFYEYVGSLQLLDLLNILLLKFKYFLSWNFFLLLFTPFTM